MRRPPGYGWYTRAVCAPFVYGLPVTRDPVTRAKVFTFDRQQIYPVRFFVAGYEYPLLGLIPARLHLLGVDEPGVLFPFGTDSLGRDMLARVLHGARISLSIGLVGVALSFVLGCLLGGLSGFFGGPVDMLVQRVIEFLQAAHHSAVDGASGRGSDRVAGIARLLHDHRDPERDRLDRPGAGGARQAAATAHRGLRDRGRDRRRHPNDDRHLLPGFMSYLIVSLTLAIPYMILGETALSFIGIGLRPPVVSWGVMLQQAQNVRTISLHPWLLIPGLFVVIVVLCFNFLGDGVRDAADPYRR